MRFSEVLCGSLDDGGLILSEIRGERSRGWERVSPSNIPAPLVLGSETSNDCRGPVSEKDTPRSLGEPLSRPVGRE